MFGQSIHADDESYLALAIAILSGRTCEDSFRAIGCAARQKINRRWAPEEMRELQKMRESGMIWKDIAARYGMNTTSIQRAYAYWIRKGKI